MDSSASQHRWLGQISHFLEKEIKVNIDVPVSVFRVPIRLSVFKPEAYVPRVLGLGPYHHFDPDLYEMQRYKLAATSRLQKEFGIIVFNDLVSELVEFEPDIRASYHKYLDIDEDMLIWIMSIDGLFLINTLRGYVSQDDEMVSCAQLVDSSGRKLSNHDAILSDIMMLENQILIFFLSKMLCVLSKSSDVDIRILHPMLIGFCKGVSPLKLNDDYPLSEVSQYAHLLDLLYHLTVPKSNKSNECANEQQGGMSFVGDDDVADSEYCNKICSSLCNILSKLNITIISIFAKPINVLVKVPWNRLNSLSLENTKQPSIVEEIIIPSVSNLYDAGVNFCPTYGDITSIKFDKKCKKIYLPVITLNVNSEVILRNLVAYKASSLSGSLVLARYTELMNGIIDTATDAKILMEKKIIVNNLKSDVEVADLFNGMSKAIRLTNVPHIDKTIEDVNKYYHGTTKVRFREYMKKYVYASWKVLTFLATFGVMFLMVVQSFCSWKVLTFLATFAVMFLMVVQSFCSVYSCPRRFQTDD